MDWVIRTLSPALTSERDSLVSMWSRGKRLTPRQLRAMRGAATYRVLYGNPPNRWQRLGYRTAKRRRAWAAMFPGVPYPGRSNSKLRDVTDK